MTSLPTGRTVRRQLWSALAFLAVAAVGITATDTVHEDRRTPESV